MGCVTHAQARFARCHKQSDRCQQVTQLLGQTWFVAGQCTKQQARRHSHRPIFELYLHQHLVDYCGSFRAMCQNFCGFQACSPCCICVSSYNIYSKCQTRQAKMPTCWVTTKEMRRSGSLWTSMLAIALARVRVRPLSAPGSRHPPGNRRRSQRRPCRRTARPPVRPLLRRGQVVQSGGRRPAWH